MTSPAAATLGVNDITKNAFVTGNITAQTTAAVNTINLAANNLAITASNTLSVNGILSSGASAATLSTGAIQAGSAGGELVIRVNGSSDKLTVSSTVQDNTSASALTKTGAGYLLLSGTNSFTGTAYVDGGTLEIPTKSGDVPYVIDHGATLKLGYSTGGGYATTAMKIYGDGASATTGLYLAAGANYNASGQIQLLDGPTTISQYGSGYAYIGMFDINSNGMWVSSAASGSASDLNVEYVSRGYGMSMTIDPDR